MATCFKRSSSSDNRSNNKSSSSSSSTSTATSSKIAALHQQHQAAAAGDAEAAAVAAAAYAAANEARLVVELVCPVCQGLLREPVSLPCGHNLCLACLRASVEHSSLNCPLCRQRLGSWFRSTTKSSDTNLVNHDLWRLIRDTYPPAVVDPHDLVHHRNRLPQVVDHHRRHHLHRVIPSVPDLKSKKISSSGEIRKEYEVKLQQAKERMRLQDEIERLASEALMRQIYNEEEQKKLPQLAKDQLLARTLANEDMYERKRPERTAKTIAIANVEQSKSSVGQRNSTSNHKMSLKAFDIKNKCAPLNVKTNKLLSSVKTVKTQKESVPIQNAVTRVVTHQSRVNQPINQLSCPTVGEFINSSKIYGLQSKEELQVPNDIINSKKKKLGVEIVTTEESKERIGSAESAGSHDSINQEIHHFKPIRALPRTPLKHASDGRQIEPKLIRVVPIKKRKSSAVPKPPMLNRQKKGLGCSWSAFKRVTKEQVPLSNELQIGQQTNSKLEIKKTDKVRSGPRSSKTLQELDVAGFDSNNKYYSNRNGNRIVNGTKVSKKLNLDDPESLLVNKVKANNRKQPNRVKNGLTTNNKNQDKEIEIIDVEDMDSGSDTGNQNQEVPEEPPRADMNVERNPRPIEDPAIENIADRIKRRQNQRTVSNTENLSRQGIVKKKKASKPKAKKSQPSSSTDKSEAPRKRGRPPSKNGKKIKPTTKSTKVKVSSETVVNSYIGKRIFANKQSLLGDDTSSESDYPSTVNIRARQTSANSYANSSSGPSRLSSTPKISFKKTQKTKPVKRKQSKPKPSKRKEANSEETSERPSTDEKKSAKRGRPPKRKAPSSEENLESPSLDENKVAKRAKPSKTKEPNSEENSESPSPVLKKAAKQPRPSKRKAPSPKVKSKSPSPVEEVILKDEAEREKFDRELAIQLQSAYDSMERVARRTRRGEAAAEAKILKSTTSMSSKKAW
ncbi:hypothetical protein TKK_0005152 [Trichogramma kaykai]|uniref:RING-type E3 ubiquitin transferase n=1 Tax=Trichogramma kaykai TaxID=54128 RepID=A0ABD2XJI2_9HYME